jgi:hypothetical protein
MAKTPSKSPAEKIVPPGSTQKPTPVPLPRGADPAGQANSGAKTASTASKAAAKAPAGSPKAASTGGKISRADPEQVAQRAYERYQQRGGQHGGDQDDWYAAEQELTGKSGSAN